MTEHVVVIGGGMVAHRVVEALRARDTEGAFRVTVLAEEARAPYDRVGLSAFFSGSTSSWATPRCGTTRWSTCVSGAASPGSTATPGR